MLNVAYFFVMLSAIVLSVVTLSVIKLNVVMLNVSAPRKQLLKFTKSQHTSEKEGYNTFA